MPSFICKTLAAFPAYLFIYLFTNNISLIRLSGSELDVGKFLYQPICTTTPKGPE